MNTRFALLLFALLPLAACNKPAPTAVTSAPASDAGTATTAPASPVSQPTAEDAAADAKAEADVQAAVAAAAKSPPPVEGTDYVVIPNGQPFDTSDGRVEVAEIFGYVCPYCAAAQPTVRAMKAKLPADVHMVFIPAPFGGIWDTYARAYYTADAMGLVDKTHDAMYRAIHIDKTLKGERGIDTPEDLAAFYQAYGADPKQFLSSMSSFAIEAKVNRARQYITNAFSNGDRAGTPTFVVNGKYRVKGKSVDDMFRILNQLIVSERAKAAASGPATPDAAPAPAAPAAS